MLQQKQLLCGINREMVCFTPADAVMVLWMAVCGEYTPDADVYENGYVNALDARMTM